ncbi:MAG: transport-associated protein, partial [Desulfobacteraceae bacterium]
MAILTISREYGSGAGAWGRSLAGRLGYEYIDRSRILADMKALGKEWEKYDEEYSRNYPTFWERYDRSYQ